MSLILYLSQVTCCLGFFYALYHFALRKETLFESNRFYLVGSLVFSIVLPVIKIYIDSREDDHDIIMLPYAYVGNYVHTLTTDLAVTSSSPFPWDRLIIGIYFIGIAMMIIRLLTAVRQIQRIRRYGHRTWVAGRLCIQSDQVKSPFSFFNTIYFPKDHQFGDIEMKEIVAHELAHVRGRHTLDVLFMEMACILLWPSPLIYLYRKALKDVHEYVADAAVLRETHWEHYAQLLVSQQHSQLQNILSNQLIYSQLKKRLLMMNSKRSGALAGLKYLGFIPILMITLVLFSFREKMASELETNIFSNFTQQEKKLILYVAADHKMYFGLKEVSKDELESSLKEEISTMSDPVLTLRIESSLTVQDLADILLILQKLNIRTILDTDEQTQYSDLDEGHNDTNGADTLPEVALENSTSKEEPLTYAEELPRFPGCEHIDNAEERSACATRKMYEFIYTNISYPREDRENGIQGHCIVQFVIGVDGSISDIKVLRSPSETMKEEVLRLMNLMAAMPDQWTPARQDGKAVAMSFTLPVKFLLQEETKKDPADAVPMDTNTKVYVISQSLAGQEKGMDHVTSTPTKTIKVVPNPATEVIAVELIEGTHTINIFALSGNLVSTYKVASKSSLDKESINVSSLPSGQYTVQVLSASGSATGSFAIVK